LLLREADHRLSLTQSLASQLYDRRHSDHIRYTLVELLRERLYAMAQGYDAQDDVDVLAHDPAMRLATWDRPGKRVQEELLASQPTQSWLLTAQGNYKPNTERLRETLADWSGRHLRATGNDHTARRITIDTDSLPIQSYGSSTRRTLVVYVRLGLTPALDPALKFVGIFSRRYGLSSTSTPFQEASYPAWNAPLPLIGLPLLFDLTFACPARSGATHALPSRGRLVFHPPQIAAGGEQHVAGK